MTPYFDLQAMYFIVCISMGILLMSGAFFALLVKLVVYARRRRRQRDWDKKYDGERIDSIESSVQSLEAKVKKLSKKITQNTKKV